jgi:hypothetical protein
VQYLFNKTSSTDGAPDEMFDTTAGVSSNELIDAIEHFQSFHSLPTVDGRVDPTEATLAKLNQVADLSAFAQVREPDEFLSWLRRPPEWNFTLDDLVSRAGVPLTVRADTSVWLPDSYQRNLRQLAEMVLSPQQTPAPSWGVGAWDLYHGHVVVLADPATGQPLMPATAPFVATIRMLDNTLDTLRKAHQPEVLTTSVQLSAYAAALMPVLLQLRQPLAELAATGQASIFYHSFESSQLFAGTTRFAGFDPKDPRRNLLSSLGGGMPVRYVSADHPDDPIRDFVTPIELAFLVDKLGQIIAVAGSKIELVALTQEPFASIA